MTNLSQQARFTKKGWCKTAKCEILFMIIGYMLLIIGCVLLIETEQKDIFEKKSLSVIYTGYENTVCSFNTDCLSLSYDNGCRKYYTSSNKDTFNCSYLNVVFGISSTNEMLCNINHIEKGFYYPELGEVWYNSTFTDHYNIINVGDTLDLWYSSKKGECKFKYDKPGYALCIVLIVIGFLTVLSTCGNPRNRVHIGDEQPKKKTSNFIEFEEV